MQASLDTIFNEIRTLRQEVNLIRIAIIPEEEISDEERSEIHKIRDDVRRGEKFRLDDVLAELNV